MIDGQTRRTHIYISMQQSGLLCAVNVPPTETLGVQGQRVRPQPDSFWSYYPGDVGTLSKKTTSWRPQTSRITRDNKDYMTALARGISRGEKQPAAYETNEIFSSRWHQRSSNNTLRPSTGKSNIIGNRLPTSSTDRKVSAISLPETSRPTTAPVATEKRSRRISAARVKLIVAPRASVPGPASSSPVTAVPYRIPRLAEASGNFENLSDSTFQPLPGSLKPSLLKSDGHFVHQLCLNTNENSLEQLNTSRDSFLDTSNRSRLSETTVVKRDSFERTESDQEDNRIDSLPSFQQTVNDEQVEAVDDLPNIQSPDDDVEENDRPPTEREDDEDILEREKNIDEYSFDITPDASTDVYDYPNPFTEEYDQVIAAQSQYQSNNVNIEPNLRDLYRDTKIKPDPNPNIKAVFEKCVKLARLQTNTIKGEQRRRQNLIAYNRLMKSTAFDASSTNLSGNFPNKTNNNNNTDKDSRELNELKRELRCNECKRITCLGNCAPGQNYHLYKRVVSSISAQALSSRQLSATSGSLNNRDQQRCKHGYVSCPISSCRSASDLGNSNVMLASLSNNSTNRVRSSRTTFTYGQKNQRSSVDLRPRSVRQTSREVKMKFEQANLTPVVVVPLFEDESRSILAKHSQSRTTNELLPGKSFRSQRRDSLTIISPQKMTS
ncbi:unnamed protein product [Adineta ricciae]|uniref:Uncharacterized protein n=1 Tax=Adineta ricciae TaxID=249248 RepID=A0A813Q554_ADIRI|nr:unnamed protein product [Adineta ricciae]CAF1413291.1 unnamed protein product [Adineta ricciae]